jgi:hypothetical protein
MKLTRRKRSRRVVHDNHCSVLVNNRECSSDGVGSFASADHCNIGGTRFNEFSAFALLAWSEDNDNMISCGTAHRERMINHSIITKKFVLLWCHAKAAT